MNGVSEPTPDVLHSWKDISQYTGRSVRTVQRWEQLFEFPVHRTSGELKGSVVAFRSEIDQWLRARARRTYTGKQPHRDEQRLHGTIVALAQTRRTFETRVNTFQNNSKVLAESIARISDARGRIAAVRQRRAV